MAKQLYKLLLGVSTFLLIGCECPYQDELDRAQQRKTTGDAFCADMLLGTWQCYYPMIIGGIEFKQIKFISGGKADITMAKQHDTECYTDTYDYACYGNTLRFSRNGNNISLTIEGFLLPELYLRDSFGHYTLAKH